jgi:universal stress protein A
MTPKIQRILCPVDFSAVSTRALEYAERLAASAGAELVVLHAFDIPASMTYADIANPADATLRSKLNEVALSLPEPRVTRVLHAGPPGEVICWLGEQRQCDLIVMGTHGRTGVTHLLLGSVAEYVVRHARSPVVTVREHPVGEPPLAEPLVLPPKAPRYL